MIRSIGKFSKSVLVKTLVGIIILPFLFWGMGDIFRGGNQNIVASIESKKINSREFLNYLNRLNLNEKDRNNIAKTNLLEKVLTEYIGKKLISLEFESLGIYISDATLREIIKNDRTFFKDNKFSRTEYEKFLLKSSMTAPLFETNLAEQEKRRQLLTYLSGGIRIPEFLIKNEFNKENQIKKIKYIDLEKFYKQKNFEESEIIKTYNESKQFFVEKLKDLNFVELEPQILIGKKEFNENFFKKINEIENSLLDGISVNELIKDNNLNISKFTSVNKDKKDTAGNEINIENKLFKQLFNLAENNPSIITYDNRYFLAEVTKVINNEKTIKDPKVREAVINQLQIKQKIEKNIEISNEIRSGVFDKTKMINFASQNKLELKEITISEMKDNNSFKIGSIKKIFSTRDGQLNLISDNLLMDNFIIFVEKTSFKPLKKNDDNYEKYKMKAQLNLSSEIYNLYDKTVNKKYNVELNQNVIDRIKNSF